MKKTRKIISLLLSVLMIITSVPLMAVNSFAADVVNSGTTQDCTWTLDSDGVLTISGNGEMGNYNAPWGTSIKKVVIENGVTNIGGWVFYGCTSLTSVTIPDSVTSIGYRAFENTAYYNNESNWDNGILYIGNNLIKAKENVSGSVEIKQGTKVIADEAFSYCSSLTSVTVPDSVTSIGSYAFSYCSSLTSVTIGNGVTRIGYSTFKDCTSLTSITIPDGVTKINDYTFSGCTSLASVTIPDSVASIGYYAFGNCSSLTSVTIPDSVASIGVSAFYGCTSLTSITIGNGVTSIGEEAFENTAYYNNESNWKDGLLYIGNYLIKAKENVSGNVELKQATKAIAGMCFCDCSSITEVKIPEGVTGIVYETFRGCTSLANVEIPDSVTSIDDYAFNGCTSLTGIVIPESVTEIGYVALGYYYNDTDYMYYKNDGFAIYGKAGSAAERYANENGFDFLPIESAPSKFFPDVRSGDWYFNAVKFNAEKGYVTGYSNGTFGPSNNIQRQDFVLILARIAGANLSAYEGKNGGFSDVQAGAYYASAVAWAKDKGIVTGYSADNFGVGTYITREQISLILCRYLGGEASGDVDTILNAYSDGGNTSAWAKVGVAWAVENGIIGNSDYLNPNGNAGRAEVAQIIYNMSNKGML